MKGEADRGRSDRRLLVIILGTYLLLALAYGVVNPLFEVPDEQVHFFTVQYVAEERRLPVVPQPPYSMPFIPTRPAEWLGQEAAQPPLYYLLGSLIVGAFDTSAAREQVTYNPFVRLGDAGAAANRNGFVHGPWESWPWRGYAAAAHLLRALSALMGLATLLTIFKTAGELWPDHPRRQLLAVALAAFLPQFIFLHSSITNDALIILLATAALYQLVRLALVERPGQGADGYLLLGLLAGLAALTKTQGIVLLGYLLAVIVVRGMGRQSAAVIGRRILATALPAVLLAGWLWWRNWTLYGDPTAANQFVAIAGGDRGYSLLEVLGEFSGFWLSLFALFGWFNVRGPEIGYWLWTAAVILALFGALGDAPWRRAAGWWAGLTSPAVLLAGWVVLVFAALVSFAMRTPAMQGRLLLPAVLPLALGIAYGLERLAARIRPVAGRSRLLALFPAIGLLTAVFTLVAIIPRVYAHPERLETLDGVPIETPLDVRIAESARLRGVNLSADSVAGGELLEVTLFWESTAPFDENAFEFVQLVLPNGERLAGVDSFSGRGLYPTGLWRPGELFIDPVLLRIPPLDPADPAGCRPQGLGLDIGLTGGEGGLPNQFGQTTSRVARVRLAPYAGGRGCEVAPANAAYQLGDEIALSGLALSGTEARPGEILTLRLVWEALNRPAADYTVFVQLLDETGEIAAQFDGPPVGGSLPTGLWRPGDVIIDERPLALPAELPAGRYRLVIGLYRPADFFRLPAVDQGGGGVRLPDDAIEVGRIEVK